MTCHILPGERNPRSVSCNVRNPQSSYSYSCTQSHCRDHILIFSYSHILMSSITLSSSYSISPTMIQLTLFCDPFLSLLSAGCRGQICQHLLPYDDLVGGRFQSWVGTSYPTKIDTKQKDLQVSFSISRTPQTSSHLSGSQTDIHLC